MRKLKIFAALSCLVPFHAAYAQQPVQWRVQDGGNGHWYALYDHGSPASRGRHASTAWSQGAHLAAFEEASERHAVVGLLGTSLSGLPAGTRVLLSGLGLCAPPSGCSAFWGSGQPAIAGGWVPGEPSGASGSQLVHVDASGGLWLEAASLRHSIWEWSSDCDEDGILDLSAIQAGLVADVDGNRTPDSCDAFRTSNAVQNGSFESNPDGQCCTTVSGWSGSVDRVDVEWFPADGGISVDLNTGSAQAIQQPISVAESGPYRLSFAYSANSGDCGAGFLRRFTVSIGSLSETIEFDTTSWSDPAQAWARFERVLTLPAGTHTLRFQSLIGGCTGPALDAVAIRSARDCDTDGIPDVDELRKGLASDLNANGVPDPCECAAFPGLPSCCVGNLNGDAVVDGADLGALLAGWGRCSGACAADLNGDGSVDGADLGTLLNGWGPCVP